MYHKPFPAGKLLQRGVCHRQRASHGDTHALISPLYYTTHHSCITRYILHTQYAPHLAKVLEQGGRLLNSPRTALHLRCSEGICKKSLLLKSLFNGFRNLALSPNYYPTPPRDEW